MFNKLKIHRLEFEVDKLTLERNFYASEAIHARAELDNSYEKQIKQGNGNLKSHIDILEKRIKRLEDENRRIIQSYDIKIIKSHDRY